jgi:hypothetical protein
MRGAEGRFNPDRVGYLTEIPGGARIRFIMRLRPGSFDYLQAIGLVTIVASLLLIAYIFWFL